ncbi:sensor domain-containing protein, partial [Kibdelosporangium lantanae]
MVTEVEQVDGRGRQQPRTLGANVYLLVSFFADVFWFATSVAFFFASLGTSLVWVGVPLMALSILWWRLYARMERRFVYATLGYYIPRPYRYRDSETGWLKHLFKDPASWRDLAYIALTFPISLVSFILYVTLWAVGIGLVTLPFWFMFIGTPFMLFGGVQGPAYVVTSFQDTLIPAFVGFLVLCLAYVSSRWVAKVRGKMAVALLGPSKATLLRA